MMVNICTAFGFTVMDALCMRQKKGLHFLCRPKWLLSAMGKPTVYMLDWPGAITEVWATVTTCQTKTEENRRLAAASLPKSFRYKQHASLIDSPQATRTLPDSVSWNTALSPEKCLDTMKGGTGGRGVISSVLAPQLCFSIFVNFYVLSASWWIAAASGGGCVPLLYTPSYWFIHKQLKMNFVSKSRRSFIDCCCAQATGESTGLV